MTGKRVFIALVSAVPLAFASISPASADQEACEEAVRAVMVDFDWPEPMRQNITTQMAGNETLGTAIATGANKALYMNADGVAQSLSLDDKFYSTTDGGKTWNLVQTYTPEELEKRVTDLEKQAANATDIKCDFDQELDGKTVHQLSAATILESNQQPYKVTYWVDAEDRFPWRIQTEFSGTVEMTIIQNNEPAPGAVLPEPTQ